MDRSLNQKINKETQALNDILDQVDLIDIFRTHFSLGYEITGLTVEIFRKKKNLFLFFPSGWRN